MRERFHTYTLNRPRTRKTAGYFLVFLGLTGLVLPLVPGLIFLFFGLEILGLRLLFLEKFGSKRSKHVVESIPVVEPVAERAH